MARNNLFVFGTAPFCRGGGPFQSEDQAALLICHANEQHYLHFFLETLAS